MTAATVEPIRAHQHQLGSLLEEMGAKLRARTNGPRAEVLLNNWKSMIGEGTGFVVLNGSDCIGMLLYSAEYDLRFSSLLSASSARKLPKSVTISLCYVLEEARSAAPLNEHVLLQSAVARLRAIHSIETIAVQVAPLYSLDFDEVLARMGFMSCSRVQMEHSLWGRIPRGSGPSGCAIEVATLNDADDLRSIVYHGYFSEIDGYLFPDIEAVCSQSSMFHEFLSSNSMDREDSVIARIQNHPAGCVLVLSDEARRSGLIGVVAVIPTMRRRGLARAMMQRVLQRLKEHGHERAALAVTVENKPALSLYTSLGFKEASPRTHISVWRRSVSRPLMDFRRRRK